MFIDFLLSSINHHIDDDAFILKNKVYYRDLLKQYDIFSAFIKENNITQGSVVALEGDFSPYSTACLLVLIENSSIIVPLTKALGEKKKNFAV